MSQKDIQSVSPDAPVEMPAPRLPRPPFWMIAIGLVSVVASWIPLTLAARARTNRSNEPRIAIIQDMGIQPKLREQQTDPIFADDRAMRPEVPGVVARGQVEADDHYYRGFHTVRDQATGKDAVAFYRGFPSSVKVTEALLHRGQERFNIYCSACHGAGGYGDGPVNKRATELSESTEDTHWTPPANLHAPNVVAEEEGPLFNTITNGIRNMPGYGNQVAIGDRWAIIAYVRALQLSQNAPKNVLTDAELKTLASE